MITSNAIKRIYLSPMPISYVNYVAFVLGIRKEEKDKDKEIEMH